MNPTEFTMHGIKVTIYHKLHLTMVDGKVTQALTDTPASSTCIICNTTRSRLSDFTAGSKFDNQDAYEFGLSPLHARIRFMEYILHLAYDLDFFNKKLTTENKTKREARKQRIQDEFRRRTGLIIDVPKQGFGNTNDGNTSRRFFLNPAITVEITGVDEDLIERFKTILDVLASTRTINSKAFGDYAQETAEIILKTYGNWKPMSTTVHKVLKHGKSIIEHHILPIGELTEEAQESRNKDYKRFRLGNTRKTSRQTQNQDILVMLLASSDPYISSLRSKYLSSDTKFDAKAASLLDDSSS